MKTARHLKKLLLVCFMVLSLLVSASQADTNVAVGKDVTASKIGYNLSPVNAVDGDTETRWSSGNSTEAWIRVDLGYNFILSQVILNWEGAYSKSYQIELSNDDQNWVSVYNTTTGNGGVDTIDISSNTFGAARYIRMKSTSPYNSNWGISIWEFEVYGVEDTAPFVTVSPELAIVKLPENTVSFDATVVDVDSTSFTYQWSQVSGPAAADFGTTGTMEDSLVTLPSVKGWYVFQIIATDESGSDSKPATVRVRLWDPAVDESLVAHWTFNEGSGLVANDIAGYKDKGVIGHHEEVGGETHHDPNWVTGWIPGDSNNYALDFVDLSYVEVTPNANVTVDPNLMNLDYGVTVACWVNANDWEGNRRIIQYGLETSDEQNIFRLLCEGDSITFYPDYNASGYTQRGASAPIFAAGEWHHVAGTYDGKVVNLYVDGALVSTTEYETYQALFPYVGQTVSIGCKNKDVPERYAGDFMYGKLDDVRIYSYPLNQEAVQDLVALGENAAPSILDIKASGYEPENVIMLTGPTTVNLDADIYDANGDTIEYVWSQESPESPIVELSATDSEDVQATFTELGVYKFRLTINDGFYGMDDSIYKEITITVNQANCERVIADGLSLVGDVNGDCRVDLWDFALIANDWLKCNDPEDPTCTSPY